MKHGVVVCLPEEMVRFTHLPIQSLYGIIMEELGIPEDMRHNVDIVVHQDFMKDNVLFKLRSEVPGIPSLFVISEGEEYPVVKIRTTDIDKYRWRMTNGEDRQTSCAA